MKIGAVKDDSQPHVLFVDAEVIMRDMARESLTEAGFSVSEAENGVRTLQALEDLQPDIILLDVMMPEMDGFATASAVRQLPGCEVVPILIMTALDDLDSINRAYEVGATDFIAKPINWVILAQRLGYRPRYGQRYPGADFRTVLHHQGSGKRNGAWSVHGSRDCKEPRRPDHMSQHPRQRDQFSNLFAGGRR